MTLTLKLLTSIESKIFTLNRILGKIKFLNKFENIFILVDL